ncbi:MAG TPA: BLUF domain-containing protein [Kofleriaceae bacterium]
MIQLVYVSASATPFDDAALRRLLDAARTNNESLGVTGMLIHQRGAFLQVLEGDAGTVDTLFWKIGLDRRHKELIMLARTELDARNFPDWTMGFVDVRGSAQLLPGFRSIGDLSHLMGEPGAVERVVRAFRDGRWHRAA